MRVTNSIRVACHKRPIPIRDIEKLIEEIEGELQSLGNAEVRSKALGDMVIKQLRLLDRVAYIRFPSVYRDFQDIESFEQVVQDLREEPDQLILMEGVPQPMRKGRRKAPA